MKKETQLPTPTTKSDLDEIDFLAIAKKLWGGRKIIFKSMLISSVVGIIIAISSPNEYTAKSVLVPQLKSESTGGLSGLAAMAGINIGISQTSAEVSPIIYPLIINSIPFQLELMNIPLQFKNCELPVSFLDHISTVRTSFDFIGSIKKYTIGLPSLVLNAIKGEKKVTIQTREETKIVQLTSNQKSAKQALESRINLTINSKEGYITVTASMPEPLAAALLTQKTVDLLQRYIIDFKIKKSKAELEFIQERFAEKKIEFEKAQENLAQRVDRNKNFTSGLSSIETDRLQAKYTLTFGVYQELARQLEQGKIQVKKETPVFVVIEPVTLPDKISKPDRKQIFVFWTIIGGILGTVFVFGKDYIALLKKLWKDEGQI